MYDVSAHKALTDIYGTGRNEAQVFDTSTAENAIRFNEGKIAADKAAKAKKAEDARKKATDLLNNQIGIVHPSDLNDFTKMQGDYRQSVLDAFKNGGGNLSVDDEAKLNQQYSAMNAYALQSAKRAEQERIHLNEIDNPNNPHRLREQQKAHEGFATSSFGDKGFDPSVRTATTPMYDINKNVVEPLATHVQSQVKSNQILDKRGISPEASAEYAKSILDNHLVKRELSERVLDLKDEGKFEDFITKVYSSPKDVYGNKNISYIPDAKKREEVLKNTTPENVNLEDVAAYEYTNRFIHHGQDYPPIPYGAAAKAKVTPTAVYNPATKELSMTDPGAKTLTRTVDYGNESHNALSVKLDIGPDGKIGHNNTMTVIPKKDQVAEEAKAKKHEADRQIRIGKELNALGLDPNDPSQEEEYTKERERLESVYPPYEPDYKTAYTVKITDPNKAESLFKQRYPNQDPKKVIKDASTNIVESDQTPPEQGRYENGIWVPGVGENKKTSPKPIDFNNAWTNLKKGERLVGPDGKTYIKQ